MMDVDAFLKASGIARRRVRHAADAVVFSQGDPANSVFYVQEGGIRLSVLSARGKEAVIAVPG